MVISSNTQRSQEVVQAKRLLTPTLAFSAALDPTQLTTGENIGFNVTGGGVLFQLGPTVTSVQQVNLGIQSVDTSTLGGTVGQGFKSVRQRRTR